MQRSVEKERPVVGWFGLGKSRVAAFHHITAALFFVCVATMLPMFVPQVATALGHREVYRELHVITGLLALVVGAAALTRLAGPGAHERRAAFASWIESDARWMREWTRRLRRPGYAGAGPNPGQRVAAAAIAASMVVLALSGLVLRFFSIFPLWLRTGASLVHTLFFYFVSVVILAHIVLAAISALRGDLPKRADPQPAGRDR